MHYGIFNRYVLEKNVKQDNYDVTAEARQNFRFLEGVRGLGALQVMLVHYISSFLPTLARVPGTPHYTWEQPLSESPFYFFIDGNVIVFVFFLLSAFVLTQSYLRSNVPVPRQAFKRFVRLFLPTAASVIFAIVLLYAFPQPRSWVAPYAQSTWAEGLYVNPMTFASLAKDLLLNSMPFGYEGVSLFESLNSYTNSALVEPLTMSMNPPLWTLHAEFWGSLLVLFLAYLYKRLHRALFWSIFAGCFFVTGTSHFTLFLLGFATYVVHDRLLTLRNWYTVLIGIGLMLASMLVAIPTQPFFFDQLLEMARSYSWLQAAAGSRVQNEVSGLLFFLSMMFLPWLRGLFSAKWVVWVGRGSFGLYLVHFPIMFTAGYAAFALVMPYTGYGIAIMFSTLVGGSLSLFTAKMFERYIDRTSLKLSDWLVRRAEPGFTSYTR